MDLREFVRETLVEIAKGVSEAQADVRQIGGYANPVLSKASASDAHFGNFLGTGQHVFLVDFDVAVIASEGKGTDAHAKLQVASLLSLGAGGKSSETYQTTSRVKFKVPLALPVDPESRARIEAAEQKYEESRLNPTPGRPLGYGA